MANETNFRKDIVKSVKELYGNSLSSATGFLDFMSYMAAAASSTIFANAVSVIGWGNLILVCFALMVFGVIISLPRIPIKRKNLKQKLPYFTGVFKLLIKFF